MADQPEPSEIVKAMMQLVLNAALSLIEADPHSWSSRPCQTCNLVSSIAGRPFGCNAKAERERTKSDG